jgi:hypothetical protein
VCSVLAAVEMLEAAITLRLYWKQLDKENQRQALLQRAQWERDLAKQHNHGQQPLGAHRV